MNIERGPRKQRGFTIIDNALAQNRRLSFGARGLAEYLLSLPPGSNVDIRSLAAENPEGRTAIAGYMNELETERYLVRTRVRGERGRFVTTTTMYEEPQLPSALPASLPKPWSKKKERGEQTVFSQVGPNPASPDFGGPDFGAPGPGGPGVGDAGDNPFKDVGERTSPSSPTDAAAAEGTPSTEEEGGGGDAPQKEEQTAAAAAFVDRLPFGARLPGPRQRQHLVERVAAALDAGWSEWALKVQLTSETATAKSLAAVYRHRLDPENLPEAPPVPAQRGGEAPPAASRKAKCPECHRPLRDSAEDALCSDCRKDLSA